MKKNAIVLCCLVLVMSLVLAGCGGAKADETVPQLQEGETLMLTGWTMNATAWSSPNGATVNVDAVPNGYREGQHADFCVRLEGEEIARIPCEWDGKSYRASADLNAADGYCYYIILTTVDGLETEVAINTPTAVHDDSLIHMETALNAFCEVTVTESRVEGGKLKVADGMLKIQLPWLTLDMGPVNCESAALVLLHNGQEIGRQELSAPKADESGVCTMDLSGITYALPENLENDDQLSLRLDTKLSNGHSLMSPGGEWYYEDGQLVLSVG